MKNGFRLIYYIFSCNRRNELSRYLSLRNIENKLIYSPLTCDAEVYKSIVKHKIPVARGLLKKSLSIPMHENMTMKQAEFVVDCISGYYSQKYRFSKKLVNGKNL